MIRSSVTGKSVPVADAADDGQRGRRVYLAGAYTRIATTEPSQDGIRPNGTIGTGSRWRQILEQTEHELRSHQWDVFLPHREVSWWGARDLTPADVARECLDAVASSDAMIAILGESYGTHVEVGLALGLGIPTVVIRLADANESYFGSGVADSEMVSTLVLPTVEELPLAVASGKLESLLLQKLPGVGNPHFVSSAREPATVKLTH